MGRIIDSNTKNRLESLSKSRLRRFKRGFALADKEIKASLLEESLEVSGGKSGLALRANFLTDIYQANSFSSIKINEKLVINDDLWPWILNAYAGEKKKQSLFLKQAEVRDYSKLVDEFYNLYIHAAEILGLYPFDPKYENIIYQRELNRDTRFLGSSLVIINSLVAEGGKMTEGIAPLIDYCIKSSEEYSKRSIHKLQEAIINKATLTEAMVHELNNTDIDMWQKKDYLTLMCFPREIRDLALVYYGTLRKIRTEKFSGYRTGQTLLLSDHWFKQIKETLAGFPLASYL